MKSPLISIVNTCFMHCRFWPEVYWSLKNQDFHGSFEIIQLHDHCDTGLGTGPAAARNRAVAQARGKWIVCNDGDNVLPRNYLSALWRAKDQIAITLPEDEKEKLIVGCPVQFISGRTLDRIMNQAPGVYEFPQDFQQSIDISVTSLLTKEAWDSVGGMDETDFTATEDLSFWCKLLVRGYQYIHTWETCLLKNNNGLGLTIRTPADIRNQGFAELNKKYGLQLKPSGVVG